jgi:hypothetical protein
MSKRMAGRPLRSAYECLCQALDLGIVVDEEDEHYLEEYAWLPSNTNGAMRTTVWDAAGNETALLLHRMILELHDDPTQFVKTVNGDWRDCRRANLQVFKRKKISERRGKYDGDFNYSSVGHRRPLGLVRQHQVDGD